MSCRQQLPADNKLFFRAELVTYKSGGIKAKIMRMRYGKHFKWRSTPGNVKDKTNTEKKASLKREHKGMDAAQETEAYIAVHHITRSLFHWLLTFPRWRWRMKSLCVNNAAGSPVTPSQNEPHSNLLPYRTHQSHYFTTTIHTEDRQCECRVADGHVRSTQCDKCTWHYAKNKRRLCEPASMSS